MWYWNRETSIREKKMDEQEDQVIQGEGNGWCENNIMKKRSNMVRIKIDIREDNLIE